jgi:hypothetical protein
MKACEEYEATGTVSESTLLETNEAFKGPLYWALLAVATTLVVIFTIIMPFTVTFGFLISLIITLVISVIMISVFQSEVTEAPPIAGLTPDMTGQQIIDFVGEYIEAQMRSSSTKSSNYALAIVLGVFSWVFGWLGFIFGWAAFEAAKKDILRIKTAIIGILFTFIGIVFTFSGIPLILEFPGLLFSVLGALFSALGIALSAFSIKGIPSAAFAGRISLVLGSIGLFLSILSIIAALHNGGKIYDDST